MHAPKARLTMVDGVCVVVPDTLGLITPYVLVEQQDWFEDELRFLRGVLTSGSTIFDIGANYGVYATSLARVAGPHGRVIAFEPASVTASFLAETIAANGFRNIELVRAALSSESGKLRLTINENSELNSLTRSAESAGQSELVDVVTLDAQVAQLGMHGVDFVKIDAEGEESNILRGGRQFLAEQSPLIQFEVKAGTDVNLQLVDEFSALGFDAYRLVPGLGALVPFDPASPPDGYLLNLFAAKPDRAAMLSAAGHLVARRDGPQGAMDDVQALLARPGADRYHWRQQLATLPYAASLAGAWQATMASRKDDALERALALHAISRDHALTMAVRFAALDASLTLLKDLCAGGPSGMRQASLARVARAHGARELTVSALSDLNRRISRERTLDLSEPFLAPRPRFDGIEPGAMLANWLLAGILEELESASSFSSFYTGPAALPRLELIGKLGFADAEMLRRLQLVRQRFN
jgi:FkbM family methyltransferase